MKQKARLITGFILICLSVIYLIMSFSPSLYWSSPFSFFALTITGVPFALCGTFLISNSLHTAERRRKGLLVTGILIAILAFISWILSIVFIIGIYTGSGYWHAPVYSYNGDYMILGFHVFVFFLSVILGLIGGLLSGFGMQNKLAKSHKELDSQDNI